MHKATYYAQAQSCPLNLLADSKHFGGYQWSKKQISQLSYCIMYRKREWEREREHYNSYYPIKKYKASQFKLSFYEYKKGKEEKKIDKLTYEHIS